MAAAITTDADSDTKADPGVDAISYTATITNNTAGDISGLQFNDTVDPHTTIIAGSAVAAGDDAYSTIGNVNINVPLAQGVLANDFNPNTGNNTGMTVTSYGASTGLEQLSVGTSTPTAQGGTITVQSDGSFIFDPKVGFSGTDTFKYASNQSGSKAIATVRITVTGMIWFVKNDAAACTVISTPCGTLAHPFSTLAAFQAVNDAGAGPPLHPKTNDSIFIYTGSVVTTYIDGVTLLNGQKLIGQGATASIETITGLSTPSGSTVLPATSGTNPVFSSTSLKDNIRLGTGNSNLIRGFTVGNSGTATGDSADISGTSIGTLTVSEVTLNGSGQTLKINGGALSGSFTSVTSTASTGGGMTLGPNLVTGSINLGSTTISGFATGCITVSNTTANVTFGNTSCTLGGIEGVNLSNNTGGLRTFGTLTVSGISGTAFIHGSAGGDVNITGTASLTSTGGNVISVSAPASGDLIDFQGATSATTGGSNVTAVNWAGASGATMQFSSLSIQRNNGIALNATTGGTITINNTGSASTITNTTAGGPAIVANAVALGATFNSINSSASAPTGTSAVSLTNVAGTSNFGTGSLSGASGATFLVSGGTESVTYNGTIGQANANPAVSITGHGTGTFTFGGNITGSVDGADLFFDNADGTYNFNATNGFTNGAGINITNGSGGTFSFSSNTSVTNGLVGANNACFTANGSTAGVTYSGNITKSGTSSGLLVDINTEASGTITFQTGTLLASSTSGTSTGIQLSNADGTVNFNGTNTLNGVGGDAGIDIISGCAGTITFSANTAVTNPSGIAYREDTSTASVNYGGTIGQNNAASAVSISAKTGGTTSFTGAITASTTTATAINLTGSGGTISFSGGLSLTVSTGTAFNATGGGVVNVSGTNNATATGALGKGINWATDTSASTITFNNVQSTTGAAVTIASSGATNFTFNDVTSTTGIGVTVTGGSGSLTFHAINVNGATKGASLTGSYAGAFSVTGTSTTAGSGGTIQNTSGRGIEVVGPASPATQPSVSVKNMNLTTTGQSNTEANPTNCGATSPSGGNINCNAAIHLNNVNGATFDNDSINGTLQNGINGLNVIDLKILNSTITNAGNDSGESGVFIQNLTGLNTALTNSTFSNNRDWQFAFVNFTSGALGNGGSPFNVSNCTFIGKGNAVTSEDGFLGRAGGTSTAVINIGGGANLPSHFTKNYSYGIYVDAINSASLTATVNGNDFGAGGAANYNNSGIGIGLGGTSTVNYTFTNNTIVGVAVGTPGNGVGIVATTGSTSSGASIIGTISGNTIGDAAIPGSGGFNNAAAVQLLANGGGNMVYKATVTGNHIHNPTALGIQYIGGTITGAVTGTLHITGNDISTDDNPAGCAACSPAGVPAGQAIAVAAAASGAGGSVSTLCADIGGAGALKNTITGTWDGANADAIRVTTLRGSIYTVGNMPGAGAQTVPTVTAFVSGQNNGVLTSGSNTASGGGTFNANSGAACPLLLALGGVSTAEEMFPLLTGFNHGELTTVTTLASTATVSESLSQQQLDSVRAAAIERWASTGLTTTQVATLRGIKFEVSNLNSSYLGESNDNNVQIDRHAGGKGWYTGADATSDSLFSRAISSTRRYTDPFSAPAGRLDLLTAIEHEMGHKLGLDDSYSLKDRDNLMYGYLTVGERRTPAVGQARNAKPEAIAGVHHLRLGDNKKIVANADVRSHKSDVQLNHARSSKLETRNSKLDTRATTMTPVVGCATPGINGGGTAICVDIPTIHAGDSVTITFQVTVNNPPNLTGVPPGTPQVSNFGAVSGTASATTNTVNTPVDLFNSQATVASDHPGGADQGDTVTFTATVVINPSQTPTPPSPLTPTGTVTFKSDGTNITGCVNLALSGSGGTATVQCPTSALLAAGSPHSITAFYSGDGNYDPSDNTVAPLSQSITACNASPVVNQIGDAGDGTCDATCTLRDAVTTACNGSTITFDTAGVFATPQTITLGGTELSVARNVTINAPSAAGNHVTVSANNASRVFAIQSGKTVSISNLTISNGHAIIGALFANEGGGIYNDHGTLMLTNCVLSGNTADDSGGGIFNNGFTSGSASTTVTGCTFSGNTAVNGGGLYNYGDTGTATMNISNSTFAGNTATGQGGAMDNFGNAASGVATLTIVNSTISGNNSNTDGGGIYSQNFNNTSPAVTTTLTNVTVTNNRADNNNDNTGLGGGIFVSSGTVTLNNTIVAGNFNEDGMTDSVDDVNGALAAASTHNLIGIGTGMTGISNADANANQVGSGTPIDAMLGPLQNNGGPTFTHALLPTSPAIEAGDNTAANAASLTTDQRGTGYPRIADSSDLDVSAVVDIGAFELHPSIQDIADTSTNEDTAKMVTFNLGDDVSSGGTLIQSVDATSSNTALVTSDNTHLAFTGSGGSRTLTITPNTNANSTNAGGTTTITVTVTATNGRTASDQFDLTVNAQNDSPTLTNNTGTTVNEASTGNTITSTQLRADDVDNTATQLTFTVGAAPANGTLKKSGVGLSAGGTFTQDDINNSLLTYDHDGSETTSDSFSFTVSDGAGGSIGSTAFNITVTPVNDPPTIGNNTGTTVNEASTGNTITSAMLSINDPDNTAVQLVFTVGTAPANGTLKKSGAGLSSGGTFTQADINNSLITYDHNGSETTSDSFTFTVSDGAGGSIGSTAFNITVTSVNDAPVVTTTGGSLSYAENDPATAVDTGVTVTDIDSTNLVGASVSITANFQSGQDALSWTDNNLADSITLSGSSTPQTVILTGTDTPANYALAMQAVKYANSSDNPSVATRTVTFTADDGAGVNNTGSGTRNITVSASNDAPTLTTNAGLNVTFSGTGTIDNTKLKVDDADNTAAQLIFTVAIAPLHGTLKKGVTTLIATSTFTQADIDANQITYTHNGDASPTDSFTFTYSDGIVAPIGPVTFNITIGNPPVNVQDAKAAEPASGTSTMLFTVALGGPAPASASVNYATADQSVAVGHAVAGTCGAGGDYVATSGTLNFAVGQQYATIAVPVCADAASEPDETFLLNLSSPSNVTIADGQAVGTITNANTAGTLIISELRTSGPGGLGDDFVELYNNTDSPLTVMASDASAGYGLFKMGTDCNAAPVLIATLPNGTIIPARGHYLVVGSQYSLAAYAAGNQTMTSDIESDRNVALFSTANVANISSANRLDAVGFGTNVNSGGTANGVCDLLREGNTLPAASGSALEYSFFRKLPTATPTPQDTNDNAADFMFVDTTGASTPMGQQLGAPGPENLSSPIRRDSTVAVILLDNTVATAADINRHRVATPNTPNATVGAFGTLSFRRRIQNNTGAAVTRLRFRIINVTTLPPGAGDADLRAITSSDVAISGIHDTTTCVDRTAGTASNCTVTVKGTLLEQPPNQTIGGAYNSTMSVDLSGLPGGNLGNGNSVELQFLVGVMQPGHFRFIVIVEALP